jgi:arylsulfatase A-like enzyme
MITRRESIQAVAGLLAAPAILRGARRTPGDKPNLLFLWTDQQRADTLAAYGNHSYRVPALNRLASESVVFDRCYVTQPVCTPSRSAVMTGRWPHSSGCVRNNIPLRADVRTLPELLADSSYRTGYMGKWHLGDEIFPQRGFEEWAAIEDGIYRAFYSPGRDPNARSAYHQFLVKLGYQPGRDNLFSRQFATTLPVEHSKPSFLAIEASKFILKNRQEPWILYVNFLEPHTPFSSALNDLHSAEEAPLPKNHPGIPEGPEPAWYQRRRAEFLRKGGSEGLDMSALGGWQRTARNYAGLCALVDQAVARILWALEASGQIENTIVAFTSDHGEMLGSHSLLAKQVMYEEAVRVPFLLRVPFRNQKPQRVLQPVSHIDMAPTLLDLLGRKDCCELQGQSLVPALAGRPRQDGQVFIEWTADAKDSGAGPNGRTIVSAEGWKLVWYDTDQCLLFNRKEDPLEMRNLYGQSQYAGVVARLRSQIREWQRKTGDKESR